MQNVRTQTRLFPSWAAIAAGLLTIVAAAILVLYFSAQLGHGNVTSSSAPAVTKSAGSELVQHNTSERNALPTPEPDRGALRLHGPK
jgi:hypothetical protein